MTPAARNNCRTLEQAIADLRHTENLAELLGSLASGINLDLAEKEVGLDDYRVILPRKTLGYMMIEMMDQIMSVRSSLDRMKEQIEREGKDQ